MKPLVECTPNGPYIVKNLEKFQNSKNENIPVENTIALCRCGSSNKKPFCDGSHAKIGFSDTKLTDESKDKRDNYMGEKITIHDNRGICSHAGLCTDNLGNVFRLKKEPWIDPYGADAQEIIKIIEKCPSGALSYSIDNVEHRDQKRESMITVSKDGPLCINGEIELKNIPRMKDVSKEHYTLCRCGSSKNKPYCDGSHWDVKFHDDKN